MWRQEEGQLFRGDSIHTRKGNFSSIAEKAHDRSILVLLVAAMHKLVTSNHMRERERDYSYVIGLFIFLYMLV